MMDVFTAAGFRDVRITQRYNCFAGTTKERTAQRYGVIGANVSAIRELA